MAYISLPLYADPVYDYTINLGNSSFRFEFLLNERQGIYHFNIFDANENPLYLGLPFLPRVYTEVVLPEAPGVFAVFPQKPDLVWEDTPFSVLFEKYSFIFFEE